jgi:8-oxo-dGTP pyrophosphatase MutT (NUDIX family)
MKKFKNKPNELITTTDGRKLYHSRSVAVTGCIGILKDLEFYFVIEKRGNAPGLDSPGKWCIPCGYLDWNESGSDAIRREAWEEVGIDMHSLDAKHLALEEAEYMDQPWMIKTEPDENRQNVSLRYGRVYIFKKYQKLPKLKANNDCEPNEVADAKWVKLDELNNYQFAFNHKQVLKDFLTLIMDNV